MEKDSIYYNYLEDMYPKYKYCTFVTNDIDQKSAKLCEAIYKLYFNNIQNNKKYGLPNVKILGQNYGKGLFYSFSVFEFEDNVEKQYFLLSIDYIGPSVFQSENIGKLESFEIQNFLTVSRTLGGHLLWPRGRNMNPTINQVKGGEINPGCGYGFYDRIDWVLLLLKIYYLQDVNSVKTYLEKIEEKFSDIKITDDDKKCFKAMYQAFDRAKDWFEKFESFQNFCDFFRINKSFVEGSSYDVIGLTSFFPIKPSQEGYLEYIRNNLKAINKRNILLEK